MSNEQSLGQRRVRVSFNPSQASIVDTIKADTARLIDTCEGFKQLGVNAEGARCAALAQTAYEEACMWAVKAATA